MENIPEDLLFTKNTDSAPLRKYLNIRYYRTRPSVFLINTVTEYKQNNLGKYLYTAYNKTFIFDCSVNTG